MIKLSEVLADRVVIGTRGIFVIDTCEKGSFLREEYLFEDVE